MVNHHMIPILETVPISAYVLILRCLIIHGAYALQFTPPISLATILNLIAIHPLVTKYLIAESDFLHRIQYKAPHHATLDAPRLKSCLIS